MAEINLNDPEAQYNPQSAPRPAASAASPATPIAKQGQNQPAGSVSDPEAIYTPQVNYSTINQIPKAFLDRLTKGQAVAEQWETAQSRFGEASKAMMEAALNGAKAGYDAQSLAEWHRQNMETFANMPETWKLINPSLQAAIEAPAVFMHALNGVITGAGSFVGEGDALIRGADLQEQAKAQASWAELFQLAPFAAGTEIPLRDPMPITIADHPLVPYLDGHVARLVKQDDGSITMQDIGTMPRPVDFDKAAKQVSAKLPLAEEAKPRVEQNLYSLWKDHGVHPNEVVDAMNKDASVAQDLSAAKAIPPELPVRPDKTFIKELSDRFNRIRGQGIRDKVEMLNRAKEVPNELNTDPRFYQYMEGDPEADLNPQEIEKYNKHLTDLKTEETDLWQEAVDKGRGMDLASLDPNYAHRMVIGRSPAFDKITGMSTELAAPQTGVRNLPRSTSSMQERAFFVLQDTQGNRQLVHIGERGDITAVASDGEMHSLGSTFKTEGRPKVGDQFEDGNRLWTLRNAYTREIEGSTKVEYYKNAVSNTMDNIVRLRAVVRALAEVRRLRSSPEWQTYTRRAGEGAPAGYRESTMPLFRGDFMDPKLANVIDDFYGHRYQGDVVETLNKINQAAIKSMFWTPIPHAKNTLSDWFAARGFSWINPIAWKNMMMDFPKAFNQVITQGPDAQRMLAQGSGMAYGSIISRNFHEALMRQLGTDIKRNPAAWDPIAKVFGFGPSDLYKMVMDGSNHALWAFSDTLMLQRLYELERQGMETREAIAEAEKYIAGYRIPPEVLGSRFVQRVLTSPMATVFSHYHYFELAKYAHMIKDLFGTQATMGQRYRAAGTAMATALQITVVAPILTYAIQKLSGDKNIRIGVAGSARVAAAIADPLIHHFRHNIPEWMQKYYDGNTDYIQTLANMVQPSPLGTAMVEAWPGINYDMFSRKPIAQPGDMRTAERGSVRGAARVAFSEIGHLASIFAPAKIVNEIGSGQPLWQTLRNEFIGATERTPEKEAKAAAVIARQTSEAQSAAKKPANVLQRLEQWLEKEKAL